MSKVQDIYDEVRDRLEGLSYPILLGRRFDEQKDDPPVLTYFPEPDGPNRGVQWDQDFDDDNAQAHVPYMSLHLVVAAYIDVEQVDDALDELEVIYDEIKGALFPDQHDLDLGGLCRRAARLTFRESLVPSGTDSIALLQLHYRFPFIEEY